MPGHHSTGRSAAIFIRNYGNATLRALNAASAGFLAEPAEISESTLLTPRGELLIAANGEQHQLADYLQCSTGIEALQPLLKTMKLIQLVECELVQLTRPLLSPLPVGEWSVRLGLSWLQDR